jgi:triacylglycerol lipase
MATLGDLLRGGQVMTTKACVVALWVCAGCSQDVAPAATVPRGPGSIAHHHPSLPVETAPPPLAQPDPSDPSGPPYPIVLMHGMFGFKTIANIVEYWNGIPADLAAHGETQVFVTQSEMLASSATRAATLAPQLDEILRQTGKRKLNLIGHSQGGLDARYLVSSMGYGDRVASITLLSTPNHGSRVADAALGLVGAPGYDLLTPLLLLYGLAAGDPANDKDLHASLVALSEADVQNNFNPANPDDPRVDYFSWAGRSNLAAGAPDCINDPKELDAANVLFVATGQYLQSVGMPDHPVNDGLVSVRSARWGTFMGCVPADHLDEVGTLGDNKPVLDHLAFLRGVVANVRAHGF